MTGASCRIYFWICKNLQNFFWKNKYSVFLTQNENWGISQHWILHNDSGHRNVRQHPCLWNDWWRLLQVRLWSIIKLHLFFFYVCIYSMYIQWLITIFSDLLFPSCQQPSQSQCCSLPLLWTKQNQWVQDVQGPWAHPTWRPSLHHWESHLCQMGSTPQDRV